MGNEIEVTLELADKELPVWAPVVARVRLTNKSAKPVNVKTPCLEDGTLGFVRRKEDGQDDVIPQDHEKLIGKLPFAVESMKSVYWSFIVFRRYDRFVNDRLGKEKWHVIAHHDRVALRSGLKEIEWLPISDQDREAINAADSAMKAMNWALEGIKDADKAAEVRSVLTAAKEKIASEKWKEKIASFERMLAGSGNTSDESLAAWCEQNRLLALKNPIQAEVEAIAVAHSLLRRGMHDWSDKVIEPYPAESRDRWALMDVNKFQRNAIEYQRKKQLQENK
jgi:hypothetical protein